MARQGRRLGVWLHGVHLADLTEPSNYRYRLEFTEEALDTYGPGARVLSLALPVDQRPIDDRRRAQRPVGAFLEGLLPEGNLRRHIATAAKVPTMDKMEILRRVGAECAGAVQFLEPDTTPQDGNVRALTSVEVDRLVAHLPTYHLPEGSSPQASLAGLQDKVLLTAMPGGGWGWPMGGAPSTHIVKPEPLGGAIEHLVQTEEWALRVAQRAGIRAARAHLANFDQREAIVVERYDRAPDGRRTHQEDFCQALGLDPGAKYENTAEYEQLGSRLSRVARIAADRSVNPSGLRTSLLEAITLNVIIGNGDAHSKNYSLLISRRGEVSLAPLYDSAPVGYLDPRFKGTGHVINGKTSIDQVATEDLAAEAAQWGVPRRHSEKIVSSTMERVRAAVDETALPEGAEQVSDRLEAMWVRRSWSIPAVAASSRNAATHTSDADGSGPARVWVDRYTTASGTTVQGYWRRRPHRTR